MCREMGLPNSHIFFEKCFLLVEGEGEENYIPGAYKRQYGNTLAEDGITLINLKGNGAAANFLKLLSINKKEQLLLMLDADTNASSERKTIEGIIQLGMIPSGQIKYIGNPKEFEDIFPDDLIAKVLNANHTTTSVFTPAGIRNLRKEEKFSDALIKLVATNTSDCNGVYLSKPKLAGYLVNENIPQQILDIFEQARRIAEV